MALAEQQQREIASLVAESSHSDPIVTQVVALLGDHYIVTSEDLKATHPQVLEKILPDQPRYPYSPLTLGRSLKAIVGSSAN